MIDSEAKIESCRLKYVKYKIAYSQITKLNRTPISFRQDSKMK